MHKHEVKCKKPRRELKLGSFNPFPTRNTVTPRALSVFVDADYSKDFITKRKFRKKQASVYEITLRKNCFAQNLKNLMSVLRDILNNIGMYLSINVYI